VTRAGRPVVVKVQRPGIHAKVTEDLEVLERIAELLDKHTDIGRTYEFGAMVKEFRASLMAELDYRREASHLTLLADNLAGFDDIVVPRPVDDYVTSRVLTMDYIPGVKVTSVSPLGLMEIDGERLAESVFKAYLKQIFIDGFFHADPHPGNVHLADDGRIALIDLGMAARLTPRLQERLLQLVLAVSDGRADEAGDVALTIAEKRDDFDEQQFRRNLAEVVARNMDVPLGELQIGRSFVEMAQRSTQSGLRMPPELTMLGKTLMNLDAVGRALAPEFNPQESIRRNGMKLMNQRLLKTLTPGNLFTSVLELKSLVERMPARVNKILDNAANNQLKVNVDTGIDPAHIMVGLQKVANRISVGMVIAALIVGAAMLMRIPSGFTILGYPGLAMVFFLMAGGAGLALIYQALFHDFSSKKAVE
jgi:predicted unusual protein kinase regulating ubiquinone biosynthesis (AarF/ABC1/UbiB family)